MIELIGLPLYQWDTGREVSGFTGNAVQFANQGDSQAMTIEVKDGSCRIPDRYLMSGSPVLVYDVTVNEGSDVTTTHSVRAFPVNSKPKPKDYIPTAAEEAFGVVKKLTDEAKTAAREASISVDLALLHANDAKTQANDARSSAARAEQYAKEAGDASKKGSLFVIKTEGDTFEANFGAREIFEEVSSGRDAVLQFVEDGTVLKAITLSDATESMAFFVEFSDSVANVYTVNGDGYIDMKVYPIALFAVLDDKKCTEKNTWSAKNIADKLCPPIHESGTVVQCEPVEGYPMAVTVDEASVPCEITLCGKNLYDPVKYPLVDGYYINKGSGAEAGLGSHEEYCATRTYIPVAHLRGKKINLNHIPGGNSPGMAFYDANKVRTDPGLNGKGNNQTVPDDAVYMKFCTYQNQKESVQIELGSVATTYEPYSGTSIAVEDSEVEVTARGGVNTIYTLAEDSPVNLEVTGRSDPVAIIEKLTNAIISLGGNV